MMVKKGLNYRVDLSSRQEQMNGTIEVNRKGIPFQF
jgi:hypothetical protein